MTEVTGKQQEVMGDGSVLTAPFGDEPRGERMAKIVKTHIGAGAIGHEVPGQPAKGVMDGLLTERSSAPSDKESVGEHGMTVAGGLIAAKRPHCRRMQRQNPFGAEFCARNPQSACLFIEILFA